jgi:hypothetical protein
MAPRSLSGNARAGQGILLAHLWLEADIRMDLERFGFSVSIRRCDTKL